MKEAEIIAAKEEAQRFIAAANERLKELNDGTCYHFMGSLKSGALRRRSMDLTRALSAMRKSS